MEAHKKTRKGNQPEKKHMSELNGDECISYFVETPKEDCVSECDGYDTTCPDYFPVNKIPCS